MAVPPLFGEAEQAVPREGQQARSLVFMKPRHRRNVYCRNIPRVIKRGLLGPKPKPKLVLREISQLPLGATSQPAVRDPA